MSYRPNIYIVVSLLVAFSAGMLSATPTSLGTLVGEAAGDFFGCAVSFGNFNNDSWGDILVGACEANTGTGEAYIYYGSSSFDTIVDVTLDDGGSNDSLGTAVAGHSDYDGDGYTDAAIGLPGWSFGNGHVYIYERGLTGIDFTLGGDVSGELFGAAINSYPADFNRDSYHDIAVGAPGYSDSTGCVYIYWGGDPMNATIDVTIPGASTYDEFGYSITCAKVTGDDTVDIIIGAPGYGSHTGRVYVYEGSRASTWTLYRTYTGEAAGDRFGQSVHASGRHLIIGAPEKNTYQGKIYVYRNIGSDTTFTKNGEAPGDEFGYAVLSANTTNLYARANAEAVVGAPERSTSTGKVYSYRISNGNLWWTLTGTSDEKFGYSISSGKAVDGAPPTAAEDIAIGAPRWSSYQGHVYVYTNDQGDEDGIFQNHISMKVGSVIEVSPNPFHDKITFSYDLPLHAEYRLCLFDAIGRKVRTMSSVSSGGSRSIIWDRKDDFGNLLESGVYFYRLESTMFSTSGKVVVE